jgi:hypothetical protein
MIILLCESRVKQERVYDVKSILFLNSRFNRDCSHSEESQTSLILNNNHNYHSHGFISNS